MKIFLLSSERSGSNLLRMILDAHSQISAPSAPQIARILGPLSYLYGDLSLDANIEHLAQDMITLTQVHPNPWPAALTANDVLECVRQRSFWGVFDALYTLNAERSKKLHWFSKENNLFDYAFEILHELSDVKFIYLVRDGRDYACSMRRMSGGHFHYFKLAQQWQREQATCLRIQSLLKNAGPVYLVRYEDLLSNPQETLRNLTAFLEVGYEDAMLDFYATDAAQKAAAKSEYWENLARPLMHHNFNKYKKIMNPKDVSLFEAEAGLGLRLLGYECEGRNIRLQLTTLQRGLITIQDLFMRWYKRNELYQEPNRTERAKAIRAIKTRLMRTDGFVK